MHRTTGRVEDYTNAFLVSAGCALFMALFTLATIMGMIWVLLAAAFLDGLIRLIASRLRAS